MNWKTILTGAAVTMMSAALLAGCGGGDKAAAPAKDGDKGKIVVGLDDNFPPMGFKDEKNEIVGFDVDLAKEAAKRLGREIEFKAIDWSSKEAELKSGRVQILWNGLDITEKRKENMLFSDPYMDSQQVIFVRKGDTAITDEQSLAGKVIGTQSASTAEEYIDATDFYKKDVNEVKKYPDFVATFMDLENGRLDAVVGDRIVGRYYMSKHPDKIEERNIPIGPKGELGIAFAKDNTALRDEVQKVMNEMKADGTAAKISEEWFQTNLVK